MPTASLSVSVECRYRWWLFPMLRLMGVWAWCGLPLSESTVMRWIKRGMEMRIGGGERRKFK